MSVLVSSGLNSEVVLLSSPSVLLLTTAFHMNIIIRLGSACWKAVWAYSLSPINNRYLESGGQF